MSEERVVKVTQRSADGGWSAECDDFPRAWVTENTLDSLFKRVNQLMETLNSGDVEFVQDVEIRFVFTIAPMVL